MPSRSKHNMRLSAAVERYLGRLKLEGQSPSSQRTVYYALLRFQKFVATRRDPDPYVHLLTPQMMDDYCYGPEGLRAGSSRWGGHRPIKSISFNRYRSVLSNFFAYAVDLQWVDDNPMAGIRAGVPDAPVKRLLLSASEMVLLLEQCANPIERIGCSLGMNTGLRSNDIRHLTVFDANLNNGVIQTDIRKTKKLAVKPITMELEAELVRWLDIYAELTGHSSRHELPNDYLLVPSYRNAAPNETLKYGISLAPTKQVLDRPRKVHSKPWALVQRPLARLGYPTDGEGFHTLRRSSARALFESLQETGEGRDRALMTVQLYLNHASTIQTQHYLGLEPESALLDAKLRGKSFLPQLASLEQQRGSSENGKQVHLVGA